MISIDKLHSYLNKKSSDSESEEPIKNYTFKIPESKMADGHIYGRYIMDGKFAFLGKDILPTPVWCELPDEYQQIIDKVSVKKNSFITAILNQVMPEFRYFEAKSRVHFVKDLMRQIAFDMEEKSLYKEMEYTRQRNNIRAQFTNCEDIDNDDIMKKIVVDYFSLTVYVIKKTAEEKFGKKRIVEKISFVPGVWKKTDRENEYVIKNPSCILIENQGKYSSVIKTDMSGLFSWQDEGMIELFTELSNDVKIIKKKPAEKKTDEIVIKECKLEKSEALKSIDDTPIKTEIVRKKTSSKKAEVESTKKEEIDQEKTPENVQEDTQEISKEVTEEIKEDKFKMFIPKKITLTEIQLLAEKEGISIVKKSEKTSKDLKKSIQELRDEIMKKYE